MGRQKQYQTRIPKPEQESAFPLCRQPALDSRQEMPTVPTKPKFRGLSYELMADRTPIQFQSQVELEEDEPVQGKFASNDASIELKGENKPKENQTGLPDNLKAGIENLSGMGMDGVKVHYNSPKPEQLEALAYTQGTDIHVAPGQEQHLPHEVWHVVQQMQGRVQPTIQTEGVQINDDEGLEREADVMGGKALQLKHFENSLTNSKLKSPGHSTVIQLTKKQNIIDKGFSDQEAESLKTITGDWTTAKKLVDEGLTKSYLNTILTRHNTPGIRKKAISQLSEHYYSVATQLCNTGGANLESLINKGLNNKIVDQATGYPVPSFRATLLSLHSINEITNIIPLGRIITSYPLFEAQINAQKAGNPTALNQIIQWLAGLNITSLKYIQHNNPAFNVLEKMREQNFGDTLTSMLSNFHKEVPPGNNDYENNIGIQGKHYRVGHYARYHSLRAMPLNHPLSDVSKTLWPLETTVNNIRTICGEFDDDTDFEAGKSEYFYTPPFNGIQIKVQGNGKFYEPTTFDQMYPRTGANISQDTVTKLSAVVTLKNNWADPP